MPLPPLFAAAALAIAPGTTKALLFDAAAMDAIDAAVRSVFAEDAPPDQVARHRGDRAVLEGRVMFVNIDEASPAAGYMTPDVRWTSYRVGLPNGKIGRVVGTGR